MAEPKGVSVDLDPDLHAAVKAAAAARKQKVPEAYTEALNRWLDWVGGKDSASPFGPIAPDEERLLRGLLALLRSGDEKDYLVGVIRGLARHWADKE